MNLQSNSSGASVIPTVRYSDVGTAIEWLQEAFGLEPHRIVRDCQGNVLYGELTFGHGMIMVAPVQDSPLGKLMVQPDQVGGVETQICYLPVSDTKTHYARAKAAGAEIVLDLGADQGGGGYSCRDPQGHVWNFGTYDPWNRKPSASVTLHSKSKAPAMLLALLVAGASSYFITPAREAIWDATTVVLSKVTATIERAQAEQTIKLARHDTSDLTASEVNDELAREKLARTQAEQALKTLREELMHERRLREAAEQTGRDSLRSSAAMAAARAELDKVHAALQVAAEQLAKAEKEKEELEKSARDALAQFKELRDERDSAEHEAQQAMQLAARERSRRIAAERTLRIAKTSPYTPYPLK